MFDSYSIEWRPTRHRGIHLRVLRRDEGSGDATVLIRMEPGCSYPAHRHRGLEEVLILQGGYTDDRGPHRAGEYVLNVPGSAHQPTALEDTGEDCIMLAITHGGIELVDRGGSD